MDCSRPLYSTALQNRIYEPCVCWHGLLRFIWRWSSLGLNWTGLLSFTLLWRCLCLCWPLRVAVFAVGASRCSSWLLGVTKPCGSSIWALVRPVYGLVSTHPRPHRHPGTVSLFLNLLIVSSPDIICFPGWVGCLLFWLLLHLDLTRLSFPLLIVFERVLHIILLQGFWSFIPSSWPLCMRHYLLFVPRQHACLCKMPVGMIKKSPPGGWLLTYMMRFLSSTTAAWVAIFEFWGLPLFWLSLPLERLSALWQEPLCSRFCWQLPGFQIGRDEVKGKSLFVDEEMLSETSLIIYFDFSRGVCRVAWCFLAQVLGHVTPGRCEGQLRRDVYIRSFSALGSSVVPVQFSFSCHIVMYWSFDVMINFPSLMVFQVMFVVGRVQRIDSYTVNYIFGCCPPSVIICNSRFIRILEQHYRVLGLCLMALDVHPWMLSPAHYGCCSIRCCVLLHSYRSYLLVMQLVRCVLKRLISSGMEFLLASLWSTGFFTNCLQ